jgi:hypothetical protein
MKLLALFTIMQTLAIVIVVGFLSFQAGIHYESHHIASGSFEMDYSEMCEAIGTNHEAFVTDETSDLRMACFNSHDYFLTPKAFHTF